jgi:hypothetical protein
MKAMNTSQPEPTVMPVDREEWLKQLGLANFVNSYYQYRDLRTLEGVERVLIVGPGQGLDREILRWRGYEVVTFDIDATFAPDEIGSVHDLSRFRNGEFDAIIASHVLEHVPIRLLDRSLSEIARVARYALIYLPILGRPVRLRFQPHVLGLDWSFVFDIRNPFRLPNADRPVFCGGQHYWEIGVRGFKKFQVNRRLSQNFRILSCYRNMDWLHSMNYVLRSERR